MSPLKKGLSKGSGTENFREMRKSGRPQKQFGAASVSTARKSKKKK